MTKSKLWLPTPSPETSEPTRVSGEIVDAKYVKPEGCISVYLQTSEGRRVAAIHKSSITFHGKNFESVPESEVDREMETTADLFRKAKGRHVNLEMSKEQAKPE